MEFPLMCRNCQSKISPSFFFCPTCGKKIKEPPLSTGLIRQLIIYFTSFFLAPMGLYWGIRYLRQDNANAKLVGIGSIALTCIAIFIAIKLTGEFMGTYSKMLSNPSLMPNYSGLGL